jgi:NAD(P)-dependent dehydrogenase (short-subunit alcohol dehydrogenase family)
MANIVLVTGGARGIGFETALLAAQSGWDVAITYREQAAAAEAAVTAIKATGRRAIAVRADVGRTADIGAAFAVVDKELGLINGLVNNAGISFHNRVEALVDSELRRMFDVNVLGLMSCCREATKRMSTRHGGAGGSVVNISSMAATIGGRPGSSTYAATKGAVDVFTTGFAREVAAEGIRVNAVRPGVTDTDMIAGMRSGPKRTAVEATIPMRRFGTPREIAETVVWLLSSKSSFVSGAHLNAGGGGFHVGPPLD